MREISSRHYKIGFLLLSALLLALVFFKFSKSWSFPDTNWNLIKKDKIEVKPGYPIEQVFTSDRNNLTKIRILFGKSYLKDGGEIKLELRDESCSAPLRETVFQRSFIQPDGYYDFVFPKIEDSKGKTYCLAIDFDPQKPLYKSFYVFASEKYSPGGEYICGTENKIENQSLAMRPAYKNDNLLGDIRELNQRISQYKPWYFKGFYLYSVEAVFILLAAMIFIILIFI